MSITLVKKSAANATPKTSVGFAKAAPGDFILVDNQDDTCSVHGVDAAGNPVDISNVATLTVTSSDPSILTVDPPAGMSFKMHAAGPLGSAVVAVMATWLDGSVGPFSADLPVSVVAGPAGGILIEPGVPTMH